MEAATPASRRYEEFEPSTEIVQEKDSDTIILHLPDFKKEKLKIQLTSTQILRISGEREIESNKSIRFQKGFPISSNYDVNRMTPKFENGILYLRLPKLVTSEDKQDNKLPVPEPPTPQKPEDKPQPDQKNVQQKSAEKASPGDDSTNLTNVPDVPQKKPEKELSKATSFTSDKRENDATWAACMTDKGATETADGSRKTRMENYRGIPADLATKLKVSRRVTNAVLVALLAVVLGLYINKFIRPFRKAEI
ncbi:hypothetical protein ACH5RR_009507 [Cinchona calisaya]|uniref:SHSP domain-containing protein n=1 Tax=Cinchona calisaya TaxID=153742 RepID=A0ABD3AHH6_9GENT